MTQLVVLGVLNDREMHTAEIVKEVSLHLTGGQLHPGIVYPLLNDFSREGWVCQHTIRTIRGRSMKYYTLTQSGRNQLRLIAREWSGVKKSIDLLLADVSNLPKTTNSASSLVGLQS
jgi:PadR family transcriptional regulator PadR